MQGSRGLQSTAGSDTGLAACRSYLAQMPLILGTRKLRIGGVDKGRWRHCFDATSLHVLGSGRWLVGRSLSGRGPEVDLETFLPNRAALPRTCMWSCRRRSLSGKRAMLLSDMAQSGAWDSGWSFRDHERCPWRLGPLRPLVCMCYVFGHGDVIGLPGKERPRLGR